MEHIEISLNRISLIAEQKEKENFEFRSYLKSLDSKKVDKVVHRLQKEISAQIDCMECGNCCKSLRPCVSDSEIHTLSKIDNISAADFVTRFVEKDDYDEIRYLKDTPCKYLKDNSCTVYSSRPEDCRSFPHTHKKDFTSRTLGMIDYYGICPIVFNLYDRLKYELRYYY